jgi:ABC-type transport system involved in cytochrome bd biosynthesis fused ATPase/permease subunit
MSELHLPRLDADHHPYLSSLTHAFWPVCGAVVVLFIFFAALGAIEPSEAVEVTVVVLVLTVLWSAHAWRGLWQDERRESAPR